MEIGVSVDTVVLRLPDPAETWLRLVAWSAVLCRILHSGVLQKCAIIGDVAYESLTLHHNIYAHIARIFAPWGREGRIEPSPFRASLSASTSSPRRLR